jgi:hypothetical protein
MAGKILVFDTDGVLLGQFRDTEAGHLWAHFRVREPGFGGHVEIFNPETRTSVVVDRAECKAVLWRRTDLTTLPCDDRADTTPKTVTRRAVARACLGWASFRLPPARPRPV